MSGTLPGRRWLYLIGGAGFALGVGAVLGLPPRTHHIRPAARPTSAYDEARARFAALCACDDASVLPACRSYLLDHGGPTDSVVLLLHGMTSCPLQFDALSRQLHAAGHTVLVPRLPRNGLADRRTDALGGLRAAEMAAFGDEAVDIAAGLGRRVTVFGLSAGGLVAAWIAQHRPETARVIIAAPFLGISSFAMPYQALLRNVLVRMPNLMIEDAPDEAAAKPGYNYVRKATRSLGELMLLGECVLREARRTPPAAGEIVLVNNAADIVINHQLVALLAKRWRSHGQARVDEYVFSAEEQLGHDIIDPRQKTANPDLVYPIMQQLIERR
ncbi:MAG: alpha/beta fold hydrolase [Chloroflexi bacterium]|nr:alpha/beta fold hydrolase [Chloroflexota bacterium]